MELSLPNPHNPEKLVYGLCAAFLLALAVYFMWSRPEEPVYADGQPVILTPAIQHDFNKQIAADTSAARLAARRAAAEHHAAADEAAQARGNQHNAQSLHKQFKHYVPESFTAASTADSVRDLTRFVADF